MSSKGQLHYKTTVGKHVMVTLNVAMARQNLSTVDRGRAIAKLQYGVTQQTAKVSLACSV